MQGQKFFEESLFCTLAEKQGLQIIDFAQEIMDSNLAEEKRILKKGLGIPQQPSASLLQFTDEEIGNMKGDEQTSNLKSIGFPDTGYNVAEKKENPLVLDLRIKGAEVSRTSK